VLIVQNFIQSIGGTNDFVISFVITSEYLKLRLDTNISLLDNKEGFLSIDIGLFNNKTRLLSIDSMEFFKVWFTHGQLLGESMYITHPHLWNIVKNWIK
jgi:hypothetical protein